MAHWGAFVESKNQLNNIFFNLNKEAFMLAFIIAIGKFILIVGGILVAIAAFLGGGGSDPHDDTGWSE
ncbi:MAG: hypothetical protein MR739_00830 [Spirochaetia bacterium]|nr:hypothetical protein [Spirochaetia bacterium]